jgi:hypothetical protein
MNKKQRATLAAIFEVPTRPDVRWPEVEGLVRALNGIVAERSGSRVALSVNGQQRVFHRPHPKPEMSRAAVRDLRDFLVRAGVTR